MIPENLFSIAPIEICLDDRLTKMQIKVLLALLSFRSKNTDTVWPKRETLSERCGYCPAVISRVTTQLVALGWLEKVGGGGYSKSCVYRITVPDLKTVTESVTVTELVTNTVTEPVTRKEETIEQTSNKSGSFTIEDYIKNRKSLGKSAIPDNDPIHRYAEDAGIPIEFLHLCWTEFKIRNAETGKKQKSWPQTFRNCVRSNWYKLWWIDDQGTYQLTTSGRQAMTARRESANG